MSAISHPGAFLNVLYLEDNPLDVELMALHLRSVKIPCSLRSATTWPDFEQAIRSSSVDLILSDSNIPNFDTLDALTFIHTEFPDLPFIMFSGHCPPEARPQLLARGATAALDKSEAGNLLTLIEYFGGQQMNKRGAIKFPRVGESVIVQCKGFRCLGYRNAEGTWMDFCHNTQLSEVLSWTAI